MIDRQQPYKQLGLRLQRLRQQVFESLNEVAGTLELDPDTLAKIEQGIIRPSEEILLLLVSHFGVKDDEAGRLWEIAGYASNKQPAAEAGEFRPMLMVMNDPRIIYSDAVHVSVNNYGVVMNFLQNSGGADSSLAVARVGMSREQAQSVLKLLEDSLSYPSGARLAKSLPAPKKPKQ